MKKRIVSVLMAGALASAMLAGCGNSSAPAASDAAEDTAEDTTEEADAAEDSAEAEDAAPAELDYDGDIKVWVADNAVSFTQEQIAKFQEANPGVANATFTVEAVGEGDAASNVITDVEAGGDVYTFAQDQIARLVAAGALEEVAPENVAAVEADNDEGAVGAATVGSTLYAYPLTSDNGYFMYYDKSVVTDPTDLDAIIADCEKAGKNIYMEINSGWYQTAFFFGTGCDLSYETDDAGNFTSANVNYASDQGLVALKEMIRLSSSSAFVNGSAAGEATTIGAIVDGTWDAATVKEVFGEV